MSLQYLISYVNFEQIQQISLFFITIWLSQRKLWTTDEGIASLTRYSKSIGHREPPNMVPSQSTVMRPVGFKQEPIWMRYFPSRQLLIQS